MPEFWGQQKRERFLSLFCRVLDSLPPFGLPYLFSVRSHLDGLEWGLSNPPCLILFPHVDIAHDSSFHVLWSWIVASVLLYPPCFFQIILSPTSICVLCGILPCCEMISSPLTLSILALVLFHLSVDSRLCAHFFWKPELGTALLILVRKCSTTFTTSIDFRACDSIFLGLYLAWSFEKSLLNIGMTSTVAKSFMRYFLSALFQQAAEQFALHTLVCFRCLHEDFIPTSRLQFSCSLYTVPLARRSTYRCLLCLFIVLILRTDVCSCIWWTWLHLAGPVWTSSTFLYDESHFLFVQLLQIAWACFVNLCCQCVLVLGFFFFDHSLNFHFELFVRPYVLLISRALTCLVMLDRCRTCVSNVRFQRALYRPAGLYLAVSDGVIETFSLFYKQFLAPQRTAHFPFFHYSFNFMFIQRFRACLSMGILSLSFGNWPSLSFLFSSYFHSGLDWFVFTFIWLSFRFFCISMSISFSRYNVCCTRTDSCGARRLS